MAAIRRDITTNQTDADNFVLACRRLKAEGAGFRTSDLGIASGPFTADRDLSTWDLFVIWHVWAMQEISSDGRRNAAHMGPVFLPWHRWYLLVLEFHMQRVLGVPRDDFGLPYWDWAADGTNFTPARQRSDLAVWDIVGGNGQGANGFVPSGAGSPFGDAEWSVAVEQAPSGALRATQRPLRRRFGLSINRLPRQTDVQQALDDDTYDRDGFDPSAISFRNRLEGWVTSPPDTHNQVHVWVGGDMGPGTSPNDPIFFLNHCNVDRLWDVWQQDDPVAHTYLPTGTSSGPSDPLFRHRRLDPLYSILTQAQPQVGAMEDLSDFYLYE